MLPCLSHRSIEPTRLITPPLSGLHPVVEFHVPIADRARLARVAVVEKREERIEVRL
jgi:hypothetical protein